MTKVIDSFLFTHEFDLLELRLRLLWNHVDKFILMEGDHNFANQPKPMRFHEQAERFAWAKEKLEVIQHVGKFKDYQGELSVPGELYVEHQHRQYLYDTVKSMSFDEDDILLISDVDEIPSREAINWFKEADFESPTLCKQEFYYYNIKCHRGKKWDGTIASRFGYNLGSIGSQRGRRNKMPFIDENCGWHFAHFFDTDGIREKLKHSSHQGYNDKEFNSDEHLKKCIQENKNFLGKPDGELPQEPLPEYLLKEVGNFPLFIGRAMKSFDELWRFIAKRGVTIVQERNELEYIFNLIQGCESYLEIGTAEGNSLYVLAHALKLGAKITCVDFGETHTIPRHNDIIQRLAPDYLVAMYHGNSTNPSTYPIKSKHEVVLIDGGHDYDTVYSDAYMYGLLATKYILFHDVKLPEVKKAVDKFVEETDMKYHEFINSQTMGFGICEVK